MQHLSLPCAATTVEKISKHEIHPCNAIMPGQGNPQHAARSRLQQAAGMGWVVWEGLLDLWTVSLLVRNFTWQNWGNLQNQESMQLFWGIKITCRYVYIGRLKIQRTFSNIIFFGKHPNKITIKIVSMKYVFISIKHFKIISWNVIIQHSNHWKVL